ncbi:MAG: hypothetical protein Q9Q40_13115 [Acidobacteriota bacterium]|nr:hypothetical protein [Acidobacteriota bacterium]
MPTARDLLAAFTVLVLLGSVPSLGEDPSAPPDRSAARSEQRPTPLGQRLRRWTPIEAEEWLTPEPAYRWTLEQIAAGVADNRVMRLHYWLKQRLAPFDRPIPENWRHQAWLRQLASPASPAASAGDAAAFPLTGRWIGVGPTLIPGRVTGLSRVAGREGWLLAAMADGGAWLTRDNGGHWEPLTDREATQASGAVAADPRNPRRLYWATGEGNGAVDNYGGIGVLRSTDGGLTWTASDRFSASFRCLEVDPADSERLWACGAAGIYRSDDGGASWTQVGGGLPTDAGGTDLAFRPNQPSVIFASIWGRGLWRSEDSGGSWVQVEGGLPTDLGRNVLDICRADPQIMVVAPGTNGGGLYRSTDGGVTWSQVSQAPAHCGGQCWYDNTVAIAPDDCSTIYLGGVGFHISRDSGASWTQTSAPIHVDHHALLTGPDGEVVVGNDGGVYRSTDWGETFTNISLGLPTTQYYGACSSDVEAGMLMGGTQDRGSHRRRDADGWAIVLGGDGGMCAIAGSRLMGEYQNTALRRSLDTGASWQNAESGIKPDDPRAWVGIIEKDPSDASTLYVGTHRVYRTVDFHDTPWDDILGPIYYGRMVSALAVSPADRNVLWVGYEFGGLFRTTGALAPNPAFDNVKQNLPNRNIRRVVPDGTDPAKAWIVLGGYGYPKIMLTTDGGTTYTDVTGDLPDVPVNDLVADPGDTAILFAATDLGIYRSLDGGANWTGFSDGLPLAAVTDLFEHVADGRLIASTHGRSMFYLQAASTVAVAVPDGAAGGGHAMRAARTADGDLWLDYDTETCTAARYNLFHGPLNQVAEGPYDGAICGLSRGGQSVVPMPGTPGQSLFFQIAAATTDGIEGPHGHRSDGTPRPHSGVGFCSVTAHEDAAACP